MLKNNITIGKRIIGTNCPCFIIAEAGVNHNGSIELAKKLVDVAVAANADAIKFQTFKAEEEVTKVTPKADYQKLDKDNNESYFEMIKKLELNEYDHKYLMKYCKQKRIIFLSTPSEEKSAEMLNRLGVEAFKIGSNDIVTIPLLEMIGAYHKPMIISRGMATEEEIQEALDTVKSQGNNDIILLHCTSNYPAQLKDLNLSVLETLKNKFRVLVGYSDHSEGLDAPYIAALLGAAVIEKHITLDKTLPGPDQRFALDPDELKKMVKDIRNSERLSSNEKNKKLNFIKNLKEILGNPDIKPTPSELEMRKNTRKSVVAKYDLIKDTKICRKDIAFKRPAFGVPAKQYKEIIGRKTILEIKKDEFLTFENTK